MMGMPKMSPPQMLSSMLGAPIFVGWIMHFGIGIIFALAYTYLFCIKNKIKNVWLKGVLFGIVVFIFAQIMMAIMGMMMPIPQMSGNMMLIVIGGLIGHIVYGVTVSNIANDNCCCTSCKA